MFSARIETPSGSEQALPQGVRLIPQNYSKSTRGGCLQAEVIATGDTGVLWSLIRFVGQRIVILNNDHHPVWWGVIEDILVNRNGLQDGLSIREMYNKIRVAYSYDSMGASYGGMTDWAVNQESIDTLGFTKELTETSGITGTLAMAEAARDRLLAVLGLPVAISGDASGTGTTAQITCVGDINTFGWKYYAQPLGLEAHEASESAEQIIGQGITSTGIGFTNGGKIHDLAGRFNNVFVAGSGIRITGTGINNVYGTVIANDSRSLFEFDAVNCAFEATDDIISVGGELSFLQSDDIIQIANTDHSNGIFRVASADPEHVTVRPKTFTGELPPVGATITRGNWVQIDSGIATDTNEEFPTNPTTIFIFGQPSIQSFVITTADWTLKQIELNIKTVGSPTDSFKVELCQNNNGAIGPVVESATVPGPTMYGTMATYAFQFANTTVLNRNQAMWLRLSRTGANDANSYYVVEVDEADDYPNGGFFVWNSAGYVPRVPSANLVFRATGAWKTTAQIARIVQDCGQYVTRTDLHVNSGIYTNQYREGKALAYDEIMALLDAGTQNGAPLVATVTLDKILRVEERPQENPDDIQQLSGGRYVDEGGRPLVEGLLPVGRWISRPDIPAGAAAHYKLSPRFCVEAAYDCVNNQITSVRFEGAAAPEDILGI